MILKLAAMALTATFGFVLLKKDRADFAFVLELCTTAGLLLIILPYLESLTELFENLSDFIKFDLDVSGILIKISGIAVVARLVCELCKDAGEQALAVKFELASKVLILISAVPVFKALFGILSALVENLL